MVFSRVQRAVSFTSVQPMSLICFMYWMGHNLVSDTNHACECAVCMGDCVCGHWRHHRRRYLGWSGQSQPGNSVSSFSTLLWQAIRVYEELTVIEQVTVIRCSLL